MNESNKFFVYSMLSLNDPYHPWPLLTREEYEMIQGAIKFNKCTPTLLENFGFVNEAKWYSESSPAKVVAGSVTVYVPCFNAASVFRECLQAILDQSHAIDRCIVVDDGSTDNTQAIANDFGVEVIAHADNRGLAAARNTALRACTTEFIAGVDADTVLDRYWLEKLMGVFSSTHVAGAGGRLVERFNFSVPDMWRTVCMGQHHGERQQTNVNLFGCNSVFRTEALKEVGGFDERCKTSFDDVAVSQSVMQKGMSTVYDPAAICYHNKRDSLVSVIENAYRWRLPPYELNGAFESAKIMSARWITEVRGAILDIATLVKEGRGILTYPTYIMPLHTILIDSLRIDPERKSGAADFILEVLTKTVESIKSEQIAAFSLKLFQELSERRSNFSAVNGLVSKDALPLFSSAISELPSVFHFAPSVVNQLEESIGALDKQDMQMAQLEIKTSSTLLPFPCLKAPNNEWEARATIEQIRSLHPKKITLDISNKEIGWVRSLAIVLALMVPEVELEVLEAHRP